MLLDRRRIRRWAKWVALILAVVFVLSFLLLGVGYGGGAGFNIFDLFKGNNNTTNTTAATDAQVKAALADLAKTPTDVSKLQAVATAYAGIKDYTNAATYMEQAITIAPTQEDLYMTLASIYMNDASNYTAAVAVLNRAQAKFPTDPEVYLQLGLAEKSLGNTSAEALALQKYLSLAPSGTMADTVKTELARLAASATTTSSTAATTSTAGATASTAAPTTTTTAKP